MESPDSLTDEGASF